MLLTYNGHKGQTTSSFAVSEVFEIKHHSKYTSEPVFILEPPEQDNSKLTKITKQEFEQIKNQAKTPVILKNKLKQTLVSITFIGKQRHLLTYGIRTLSAGESIRVYFSPGRYSVLVKYDYQNDKRKPEFAKMVEFEIKERTSYPTELVLDFPSMKKGDIEFVPISEKSYMELNPGGLPSPGDMRGARRHPIMGN